MIDQIEKVQHLRKLHTRQLLQYLNNARACGGHYSPFTNRDVYFSVDEIKEELETREHIPNKKESKIIRQQKAKHRRRKWE